jgi:hypothetical protein
MSPGARMSQIDVWVEFAEVFPEMPRLSRYQPPGLSLTKWQQAVLSVKKVHLWVTNDLVAHS